MGFCPKCGNKIEDGAVCSYCSGGGMPPQSSMNNGGQQQGSAGQQGYSGSQAVPAVQQPAPQRQGNNEKKSGVLFEFFKNVFKRPVDSIADFSKDSNVLTSLLLYLITLVLSIGCIPFSYLGSDIYYAIKYGRSFEATLTIGNFFKNAGYDIWSILIYGVLFSLVAAFIINFLEKDNKVQFNNVLSILAVREFMFALLSVLYTIGRLIPLGVLRNSLIPSVDTGLKSFITVIAILGFAKLAKNENKSPAAYMLATLITVVVTGLIHYIFTFIFGLIFE